jgi:hypothetical protein
MIKRKVVILGGGTFQHIRNHLSLAAPAFGSTARYLHSKLPGSELILTKMADRNSKLVTNEDVHQYLKSILDDYEIGTIILNVAFCDYGSYSLGSIPNGPHSKRLKTSEGELDLRLYPKEKIIQTIRKYRPDIFLVGFKTTTDESSENQFLTALKMMKSVKCNLVFANDVVTGNNMVITAEESVYGENKDRTESLDTLVEMVNLRTDLTYTHTNWIQDDSTKLEGNTPFNFQKVLKFLIEQGGFIENNSNGFTPGHFCYRTGPNTFLSSQRKANHNLVFSEGVSKVSVSKEGVFTVVGKRKASVGARSQWLMLEKYSSEGYDCIVHTHNPLKGGSEVHSIPQKPFQCGSLECGMNTLTGLIDYGPLKAVFLEKHGINILFKSTTSYETIIEFIKKNVRLREKVK